LLLDFFLGLESPISKICFLYSKQKFEYKKKILIRITVYTQHCTNAQIIEQRQRELNS